MRAIAALAHGPGLEVGTFLDRIRLNDLRGVWSAGGFGLVLMMFAPVLLLTRAVLGEIWDARPSKKEGFFRFTGCTATLPAGTADISGQIYGLGAASLRFNRSEPERDAGRPTVGLDNGSSGDSIGSGGWVGDLRNIGRCELAAAISQSI
jgi:hypothetical protein